MTSSMEDVIRKSSYKSLARDVHIGTAMPDNVSSDTCTLIKGSYHYYHYMCDGVDDRGWGCGYRTLQSICSWLNLNIKSTNYIPSLFDIQNTLVQLEDKPKSFVSSREWIGSVEVCLVIDQLYNIPSKILHVEKGKRLSEITEKLRNHFETLGSLVMMGGDQDCSSKGILGVCGSGEDVYLLVLDPHYASSLQHNGWVKWQHLNEFNESSFYNLCLPQAKPT